MKPKTLVLVVGIGVVIAATAIAVVKWPSYPGRTLPKPPPMSYVAMSGQSVDLPEAGCIAPMIRELRKRPNWSLRIDDMRWTDYTDEEHDPRHASLFIDAQGAEWRDDWLRQQTLRLTDDELHDVFAAFDLGCKTDESIESSGYEGRYIAVAYEQSAKTAARLQYNAPVTLAIGAVFDKVRGKYISNRAGATKSFVLKLAGVWANDGWEKHEIVIDGSKIENDAARVGLVDWANERPATLPKGHMTAAGTFTLEGITRPIAIHLDRNLEENRGLDMLYDATSELVFWMSVNHGRE